MKKTENITLDELRKDHLEVYSLSNLILSTSLSKYPGGYSNKGFEVTDIDVTTDPYNHNEDIKIYEMHIEYYHDDPYVFGKGTSCFCTGAMLEIRMWSGLIKEINFEVIED
jgi:hypothetical protein